MIMHGGKPKKKKAVLPKTFGLVGIAKPKLRRTQGVCIPLYMFDKQRHSRKRSVVSS